MLGKRRTTFCAWLGIKNNKNFVMLLGYVGTARMRVRTHGRAQVPGMGSRRDGG